MPELFDEFFAAHHRAAHGKGTRHHGGKVDFLSQPIMTIQRQGAGIGFPLGQVMKKATEVLQRQSDFDWAVGELQDIMVYAAAAIIYLRELNEGEKPQAELPFTYFSEEHLSTIFGDKGLDEEKSYRKQMTYGV